MLQIDHNVIYLKLPLMGGGGGGGGGGSRPGPHPGTEIPNMALEWFRQMQFNSMMKTEFPVKIWARSSPI